MNEPKYVAETLAWCNKIRKQGGKDPLEKLPKGKPGDASSCPCGAATGWHVWGRTATNYSDGGMRNIVTPRAVKRFITAFDRGKLPQYIERP